MQKTHSTGNYEKLEKGALMLMEKLFKKGYRASIDEDSFREYSMKISLGDKGNVCLFFSPKKDEYKITLKEVKDEKDAAKISKLWESKKKLPKSKGVYTDKEYEADVDGSYMNGITSWASIIRKDGKILKELSGIVNTSNIKNSHQIAGEIKAVIETVKFCREHKINKLRLYYDYNGLKYWAKGLWRAKIFITQYYQDYMKDVKMDIEWVKIASHTGVHWNELTDKLAKKAIEDKLKS
jgi:ribonuclease H-related protein